MRIAIAVTQPILGDGESEGLYREVAKWQGSRLKTLQTVGSSPTLSPLFRDVVIGSKQDFDSCSVGSIPAPEAIYLYNKGCDNHRQNYIRVAGTT